MNFALPGIFVFLGIDSIDNSDFPVSPSTATLGLSPDHTEHWDNVGVGGVTKLGELRPDLTAGLPGPHLVPPGEPEADWSTLIGRGLLRLCSDWLDLDVANTSSLMQ